MGVVFSSSGVANATSLRSAVQATGVIAPIPIPTTTTLTTTPNVPVPQGTEVTLTAMVTPPTALGTVRFKDGDKDLGKLVIVEGGKAVGTITQLEVGFHQLTAVFNPLIPTAYTTSTSEPRPFTVLAGIPTGPRDTNTALAASATSQIVQGDAVTLVAAVTPVGAAGTVQFKDGVMDLTNPVAITNGTASVTTSISNTGQRQLTAVFTPADAAKFNPSMSSPLSLNVIQSPQTVTSIDGPAVLDDRGVAVLDPGGQADGRGVTVLDGSNVSDSNGLTLTDIGGRNDRSGVTLLDARDLTVLRDCSNGGLLSDLLHGLP